MWPLFVTGVIVICRPVFFRARCCLFFLFGFSATLVQALETIALHLDRVQAGNWSLQGVHIGLDGLNESSQKLVLRIERLVLPKPLDVTFVNLSCPQFSWQKQRLQCRKGYVELQSGWIRPDRIEFSLLLDEKRSWLKLENIGIAGGSVSVLAEADVHNWQMRISANALQLKDLAKMAGLSDAEIGNGQLDGQITIKGDSGALRIVQIDLHTSDVNAQSIDGRYAMDGAAAKWQLQAQNRNNIWHWQARVLLEQGAVYADPVFIDVQTIAPKAIELAMAGSWQAGRKRLQIQHIAYHHPGVVSLQGDGNLYRQGQEALQNGQFSLHSENLELCAQTYLQPYFMATALEGIGLSGQLQAQVTVARQRIRMAEIAYQNLAVTDDQARIAMSGGSGRIHWSDSADQYSRSRIAWRKLTVFGLPFESAELFLNISANRLSLLQAVRLPLLGGSLQIQNFAYRARSGKEPDVHFSGKIQQLSLARLTKALSLIPLDGTINGDIPGVNFQDGRLSLQGGLKINVFDGALRINKLVASGLFSEWPRFSADLEIDNLDLTQLTRTFSFGFIEGRLSGFVHNLYMENWHPVTFYAWLGTPDDDNSRHRISQKAVQNIASIGGGGAVDLLSRSFLRFFETFAYKKLGMGCYLHRGVCQLMGVKATQRGYYIVEGGGLPRIDVIGYNPRVDWDVLLQRLQRLTKADQAVIE